MYGLPHCILFCFVGRQPPNNENHCCTALKKETATDEEKAIVFLFKTRCHARFQRAFSVCYWVLKEISLIGWLAQINVITYANVCSKSTLKTRVATRL